MIFSDETRLVRLRLSGAVTTNELPITGDYAVEMNSGHLKDILPIHTVSNSTTNVTALAATDAGYRYILKNLAVYNADTAAATVIVAKYDGTDERIILKVTLAAADTLHYEDGRGWYVLDTNGNVKGNNTNALLDGLLHNDTVAGAPVRGDLIYGNSTPKWTKLALGTSVQRLRSDGTDLAWSNIGVTQYAYKADNQSFNSTTPANDTHFTFSINASEVWIVEWQLSLLADSASGARFDVDIPASPTNFRVFGDMVEGGGAWQTGTTTTDVTVFLNNANDFRTAHIYATIENGANSGSVTLRVGTSTGTTAVTVHRGSIMKYTRVS